MNVIGQAVRLIDSDKKYDSSLDFVKQRTDCYDGSGIGLAVCKEIVQKHHGRIEVKSILGRGSEFIVTLPKLNY